MIRRHVICFMCLAPFVAATAIAQTPQPAAVPQTPRATTPTPAPAPAVAIAPRREGVPVNIKVDVTITDSRGAGQPIKKTVSVVASDSMVGFVRSIARYTGISGEIPLNIDVEPVLIGDSPAARAESNKMRVKVNVQYELPGPTEPQQNGPAGRLYQTSIHENLSLILENGKPLVAAQSADPLGDRQVTIEVKATVLR